MARLVEARLGKRIRIHELTSRTITAGASRQWLARQEPASARGSDRTYSQPECEPDALRLSSYDDPWRQAESSVADPLWPSLQLNDEVMKYAQ